MFANWIHVALLIASCAQDLPAPDKIARFKQLDSQAESAMHARQFQQAVDLYGQAVCLLPDNARGLYGLGLAQAAAGDPVKARASLQAADKLQPATPLPLVMQVRVNFSLGDIDSLKANLRELAERFPQDVETHSSLARFLAGKDLLLLSMAEALRSEHAAGAGNAALRTQLAGLENAAGADNDAIEHAVAVEQDRSAPNEIRASAAGIAGLSYESLGQTENAITYLKRSLELDPSRENSYLALADLFAQMQRYGEAADLLDRTRKPGRSQDELEALQVIQRHRPDYPMIHTLLARAMLKQTAPDYPLVLEQLSLAGKETPSDAEIFYLRGKTYFALARYKEAVASLLRAIEINPLEEPAYYQLAKTYQKLGQPELARQQFERVKYLETSPATP